MTPVQAIHHVGIAVRSIEAHRSYYEDLLGGAFEGIEELPGERVRVGFFSFGATRIELIEPLDDDSPVGRFLDKRGEGLHHVAYAVSNVQQQIVGLQRAGYRMIDSTPRIGAHGRRIAFVHPSSTGGVLTEFCEELAGGPEEENV